MVLFVCYSFYSIQRDLWLAILRSFWPMMIFCFTDSQNALYFLKYESDINKWFILLDAYHTWMRQESIIHLRIELLEMELWLPEHLRSPQVFSGVHVSQSLVFCVVFWLSLFFRLSFFFAILLSVLHRNTAFHHLFCIFKLFLHLISFSRNMEKMADKYSKTCPCGRLY